MGRQLWGAAKDRKLGFSDLNSPRFPMFINVYDLFQSKGGNEEGGWWYDCGTPVKSVKVLNKAQYRRVLNALRKEFFIKNWSEYSLKDQYEHPDFDRSRQRGYTSCAGGESLCIQVENQKAESWPKERPYYC